MMMAVTFRAKPGKEKELEDLLNDPAMARHVAEALGATRNTLFLHAGRMVRVLEFPDDARPTPMGEVAAKDAAIGAFLQRVGELAEDGYDIDDPASMEAFNRRVMLPLAFDVRL